MSIELTSDELKKLIDNSIKSLSSYLEELSNSSNTNNNKKASLISYWIKDYVKYLRKETRYTPPNYQYHRGDVVLVNFGYRLGSELGGLHFAVVVDNYNSKKSGIVTVVPLSSKKKDRTYNEFFTYELNKGVYELYLEKREKLFNSTKEIVEQLKIIKKQLEELSDEDWTSAIDYLDVNEKLNRVNDKVERIKDLDKDLTNLKNGTIVSVSQITTISKQRIMNPQKAKDNLSEIKLSTADLDILNEYLKKLYLYN